MSYPDQVMEILADGPANSAEVAAQIGVSQRVASAVLSRMWSDCRINRGRNTVRFGKFRGCYVYSRRTATPWTTAEIQTLRGMSGHSAAEIAKVLGRSEAAVYQCANRQGVKLLGFQFPRWPDSTRQEAMRRIKAGEVPTHVGLWLGIPKATIGEWARKARA